MCSLLLLSLVFAVRAVGPVNPVPSNLWQPAKSRLPVAGNYVYLESQSGDPVGGGLNYLYTPSNSTFTFTQTTYQLDILVQGNWTGTFLGMNSLSELIVGYYGDLGLYPTAYNPEIGALAWESLVWYTPCFDIQGWFVIDGITYKQGQMTSLSMRFAQSCISGGPALYGAFYWKAASQNVGRMEGEVREKRGKVGMEE